MTFRFLLAAFFLSTFFPADAHAQRNIGVIWNPPSQTEAAQRQLQSFAETGISYLQVNQKLDPSVWQQIEALDFQVFAMLPVPFPINRTYVNADSTFENKISEYIAHYSEHSSVEAIGFFSYGAIDNPRFQQSMTYFFKKVEAHSSKPFYYQTLHAKKLPVDSLFSFKALAVSHQPISEDSKIGAYIYHPDPAKKWQLSSVKFFLEATAQNDTLPVFVGHSWLQIMQKRHSGFRKTLNLYATSAEPAFALPDEGASRSEHNIVIIFLLIAWIIFAVAYHTSPVYRKALVRYFTGHKFFTADVMQRHIRTPFSGSSILMQHTIAGGIFFYCLFHTVFSPLGIRAFYHHYPLFTVFGTGTLSPFWSGMALSFIFMMLCMLWLRIANAKITHFSQVMNLYPMPLQLNLFVISVLLTLFLADHNALVIYSAAAIFIIITVSSFIITAIDTNSYLSSNRKRTLLATVGLYTVILIASMIWMIASPAFPDVVSLAATLP